MPFDFPFLGEFRTRFDALTPADMRRTLSTLSPPKSHERALGIVHSDDVRKLWVMSNLIATDVGNLLVVKAGGVEAEAEAVALDARIQRLHNLLEVVREMFWIAAKDEIGGSCWEASGSIGLRKDFMLVDLAAKSGADAAAAIANALESLFAKARDNSETEED